MAFRLSAFYFAYFAYTGAYVAYLPLYLSDRQLSAMHIASVLALAPLARTFAPPAWGWLADASGAHRAIVVFSCAVTAVSFAALPFTERIALVIGVMSLLSAGALPLVEAITLRQLGSQPGKYGPIRLWGSIGFIAVVMGGGLWLEGYPVTTLPAALAILMLATLGAALALPAAARHANRPRARLRVTREVRALLAAGFCNAVAHGALYAFLSLHLEASGYRATAIGLLWTLGVVAEIAVFAYLPLLFRRYALSTILTASLACGAARFAMLGWLAADLWIVLLAQLLHAATFGSFHAAAVAAVHRVFPEGAHARGQTLFSGVSYGAGAAVGFFLSGWAWGEAGARGAFSLAVIASALGAFFALRLRRAGL